MYFNYSASGTPLSMTYNGANYYYVTSLQGDVIAILNSSGTVVTTYLYDAWGNILSTTGTLSTTVGRYNPLRYRGYIYDRETKLYYLQSRYYNPETGRFINADAFVATGQGLIGNNMFAYCGNNPILNIDTCGTMYKEDAGGGCGGGCYISVNVGSGGGGGGSVTINTSNWGYTNVVDYAVVSGSVADAAVLGDAVVPVVAWVVSDYESMESIFAASKSRQKYDPDPYARPNQKKQNRETKKKNRKQESFYSKNNRRDGKPAPPKHHTPGRDHRKYSQSRKTKMDMLYKQIG